METRDLPIGSHAFVLPPDHIVYVLNGALTTQRLDLQRLELAGASIRLGDRVPLSQGHSCDVGENPPHQLSGGAEELRATLLFRLVGEEHPKCFACAISSLSVSSCKQLQASMGSHGFVSERNPDQTVDPFFRFAGFPD